MINKPLLSIRKLLEVAGQVSASSFTGDANEDRDIQAVVDEASRVFEVALLQQLMQGGRTHFHTDLPEIEPEDIKGLPFCEDGWASTIRRSA